MVVMVLVRRPAVGYPREDNSILTMVVCRLG